VLVSIIRAVTATTAFEFRLCTPPSRSCPARSLRLHRRLFIIAPELRDASDDDHIHAQHFSDLRRSRRVGRLLFEKFCSPSTFSSAARSITEYFPSLTSFMTSKSEMPLPTSWFVPKMACTNSSPCRTRNSSPPRAFSAPAAVALRPVLPPAQAAAQDTRNSKAKTHKLR